MGSLVSGEITVYGRRKALIYSNISVFVAVGLMLILNFEAICLGRFIQGFAGSLNLCATNMYLGETIPPHKRSKYGIAVNSGIITGLLITTLVGLTLPLQGTPESETTQLWRVSVAIGLIPASINLILFFFVFKKESLKYIVQQGDK